MIQEQFEDLMGLTALALIGFGYLIACFSKTLAGGYYIFLFLGALLLLVMKKIRNRRKK